MKRITDSERKRFHDFLDMAIMKLENHKNVNKEHWFNIPRESLQKMINVENAELELAVQEGFYLGQVDECFDLISYSMFFLDNLMEGVYRK